MQRNINKTYNNPNGELHHETTDLTGWETLRTLTAITAAIGTMICLLILAGCTNELTGQDENRGNGQALTLGTVSIEGGNTRAADAVSGVASGHSFRDDEKLHVALTAGSAQSAGTYLYDGNNSSWSSTKTERAYWQGSGNHTLTAWWGPAYSSSSPAVYDMPSDYETNTAAGSTLNAWDASNIPLPPINGTSPTCCTTAVHIPPHPLPSICC